MTRYLSMSAEIVFFLEKRVLPFLLAGDTLSLKALLVSLSPLRYALHVRCYEYSSEFGKRKKP